MSSFAGALQLLGMSVWILDYNEHAFQGVDTVDRPYGKAVAYMECEINGQALWGVAMDTNTVTASIRAIVSALNRSQRQPASASSDSLLTPALFQALWQN